MKQNTDTLLEEIHRLLAKISRAGDESDHKKQAASLLLKCHRLFSASWDDGLGPYEIAKSGSALYNASDAHSLKCALNDVVKTIEASRFSRMRSSDSEFFALLV